MVLIDRHHGEYFYPLDQNLQARLGYYDESTFRGDKYNSNYHITFLQPSYLTRISAQKAGDEILFSRSVTQELDYQITDNQFISAVGDFSEDGETLGQFTLPKFLENDYYMRLSEIQKPSNPRFHICFDHSADTTRRLTLNQIRFYEGTSTPSYKYYFDYNESQLLPAYNSKQTDYWGYYNGRSFKTSNVQESYLIDGKRSQIDSLKMRAEILTCIHYPTGGYTEFQYEPHDYRQVVRQFPFYLQELNGDTQCGGLRIRAIKDYPLEGHPEMRTFHYKKGNKSSGILSGYPKNYDGDEHYMMTRYYYNYGNGMLLGTGEYEVSFKIYSEDAVNELSTTEGNHVTYSQVIEMRGDGSSVVYTYSNHDTENGLDTSPRFYDTNYGTAVLSSKGNSRSLFRGLLLNETGKDRFGDTTYLKQNTYSIDTVSCVHSLGRTAYCGNSLYSIFHHTIFCAFPYMSNHRVSVWSEAGNDPHVEITEYAFDSHRRLTETRRTVGGVTERETFSYTGNYSVRPYSGMKTKNMISYPVEHMKYRMDAPSSELLVSAELTTWREGPGGRYVPSAKYLAELGPGVLPSNFTPYATTDNVLIGYPAPEVIYSRTDSLGNILESVSRDGVHSAYLWNKSGVYPEMVARNANRKEFRTVNHSEEGVLDYMISEGPTNPIETFVITGPGTLILDLGTTAGQDWGITLEVTGIRTVALGSHGIQENVNNALEDYVNASSHAFIPLPAGSHSVCILEAVNYFSGGDPEEEAPELEYTLTWDTETVTGYDDVFHEDFEPDTVQSGASQVGFHSYGYYTGGNYTFELDTDPDKQYILDYRIKQNNGAWQYVRSNLTYSANGNYTIQVGTAKLDEVRVYPADSEAESYTWDAAGNLLSKTDARGVTESYEYDGLGRLVFIRDNDGNYVEHYEYNYQNR
jgi:YD repeat-containing protein